MTHYTLKQAGEKLGLSYSVVRRLALVDRKIEYIRLGNRNYRISEEAIEDFLRRSTVPATGVQYD